MPLLEKVATRFRGDAEAKGLTLRVVKTSLWASTDPRALERVLSNLVANAVRYTERGRVVVGVRRRASRVALLVGDTGVGIAPRHQRKIFEAFYQSSNPDRDRRKGFGLGLAIVERLALALGSHVEVVSELGRGSLFSVLLERSEPMPESVAISSDLGGPPSSLRVLLVEDDPLVRDATVRTLVGWSIPIEACATESEAMAILASRPHDRWHVLVDYRLADGGSGLSVVDALLAAEPRPLAVSLLTAEADATLVAEAASRGIPLLVKPLKPIRLRALLAASR
jgi:CheY-like chemotaxis protein/anti-sigma regulatory factor (Ser/Thr protein kinase)